MSKKSLIMVLSLVLALSVGLGGTLAFFTDRDAETNIFTVGNVDIDLNEDFEQGAELVPGKDIEKKPVITNAGNNDAYVWMTAAVPAGLEDPDGNASKNLLHWNWIGGTDEAYMNSKTQDDIDAYIEKGYLPEGTTIEQILAGDYWKLDGTTPVTTQEIDGVEYNVYLFQYATPLTPGETTLPSFHKVYMDSHVDIDPEGNLAWVENGVATELGYNLNTMGNPKIYIAAYGIQSEGFDTVEEAYEAYGMQWGENGGVEYESTTVSVGSDEELAEALAADTETIIVDLTADVTYDVAAWQNNAMGGESTKTIMINGNGNTLTFNQTNSDWNNVATNNDATLVLRDINITNSGHNDGPWNRHDINFACDVNLYDVVSDKALAFKNSATLENVTISDANTSDTYAIWIQPKGQTVTIDGCTIDMLDCSDGRGIKIDNQYMEEDEAGINLKVSNTTFKTEEKSAIIIKTAVDSTIELDNVNITEVAADSTNPVWVDEASAASADKIVVTGGTKIVEP